MVHVINRNASDIVYAYYLSGPNDVPGLILLESRTSGGAAFHITSDSSNTGSKFSPNIPTSGITFIGDNEVSPNRIYYSKFQQPEAVPLLNYFDVGPKDKKILRIVALRESLFVFKQEGIYRVSGYGAPFVVNLFDSSTLLTAPDTAEVLNNQIYLLSSQGVATVSDTGVSIVSRPIENLLTKLNTPNYPNYKTASFGKGYESDRTYYLYTVTQTTDTTATQCLKYNTFTNAWYRSPVSKTCAVINPFDDKMYLGTADINFIEQERKDFERTDHANREYQQNLAANAINGTTILLPSVINVTDRDVIYQKQYLTIAQFNRILTKLDQDGGVIETDYYTLFVLSGGNLRNALVSLANKLDADPGVNDTNYFTLISGYSSSFIDLQIAFNIIINKLNSDIGVSFSNYPLSSGTVEFEAIILSVNQQLASITLENEFPFIEGLVTTFESINTEFSWCPQTFGDPSVLKQISESTVLFDKTTFSELTLSFSSDLSPGFESPPMFIGSGNGIYGSGVYGEHNYGGAGNSIPFRTYVPRNKQRCRYLICKVNHNTARESYAIYGLSLSGAITSTRAYK